MTLVLNEEQVMLKDAARTFLQDRAPISHLRSLRDTSNREGFSRELWQEMVELGWSAILVPEEHGGLGYGYTGLGIVLEECGRTLTPSPLLGSALIGVAAVSTGAASEQRSAILESVAAGSHLLALACDESAHHAPGRVTTSAAESGDGYLISGDKTAVMDGHIADTLIVSAQTGDGISLFLVPTASPGVTINPYPVLDTHHAADIGLEQVRVGKEALLGDLGKGEALLDRILDAARIGVSAEMLGLAQEVFERTMGYLKERKQFGVPIGGFQALQHRAAELWCEIEMCKSLVLNALRALDQNQNDVAELASLTKAKLSETAHRAATEGVQMHGGIGMTDEFDIGFFLKRCGILENLYGDRYFHLDRFARLRGY